MASLIHRATSLIATSQDGWLEEQVIDAVCPTILIATDAVNVQSGIVGGWTLAKTTAGLDFTTLPVGAAWTENVEQRITNTMNFFFMMIEFKN
ncbi:MAG: hypothetical protein EOO85_05985 [Pedobacter sp.]|nr:MAG: hypothetical protein EOO85_05985 [Pedobacter sp.]